MSEAAEAVGVWASEHLESPCAVTESPGFDLGSDCQDTPKSESQLHAGFGECC